LELEGLLNGNPILLYFVGIFYILINENFEKSQKIIVVYMLSYCLRLFDIIEFKAIIIVLNIVAFLYLEFLTKDNVMYHIIVADEQNKKGVVKIVNSYPLSLPNVDKLILAFSDGGALENIHSEIPFLYCIYPSLEIIN